MACNIKIEGKPVSQGQLNAILQQYATSVDFRNALLYDNFIRNTVDEKQLRKDTIDYLKQTFNITSDKDFWEAIDKEETRLKALKIHPNKLKSKTDYVIRKASDFVSKSIYWVGRGFSGTGKYYVYGKSGRKINEVEQRKNNTILAFASEAFRIVERYNLALSKVDKYLSDVDKEAINNVVQGAALNTIPFTLAKDDVKKINAVKSILFPVLQEMRLKVIEKQEGLIKSGYLNDKLIDIVKDSQGRYITRLYESHRNPDFAGYFEAEYEKNSSGKEEVKRGSFKGGVYYENIFRNAVYNIQKIVKSDLADAIKRKATLQKSITTLSAKQNPTQDDKVALERMQNDLNIVNSDIAEYQNILSSDVALHTHVVNYLKDVYNNSNAILVPDLGKGSLKSAIGKSIFMKKEDIPVEIRKLLGEITDPAQSFMATISKIVSYHANSKFQEDFFKMNESFMNDYKAAGSIKGLPRPFFSKEPIPELGLTRKVTLSESQPVLAKLLGSEFMYVDEQFADDVFKNIMDNYESISLAFSMINTWGKIRVTIADVTTAMGNFVSNVTKFASVLLVTRNKSEFLQTFATGIKERSKQEFSRLKNLRSGFIPNPYSQSYEDFNHVMQIQGLSNSDFTTADLASDVKNQAKIWDWLDAKTEFAVVKDVKNFLKILGVLPRFYAAGDNVFKEAFFIHEANEHAHALYDMSYNDMKKSKQPLTDIKKIEDLAGTKVRSTFQNYNETYEIARMLRKNVLGTIFAPFLPFLLEQYRTLRNTVVLTLEEVTDTNPKIRAIGQRRFGGLLTLIAISNSRFIVELIKGISDDEEDEKVTSFALQNKLYPEGVSAPAVTIDSETGFIKVFDYAQRNVAGNLTMIQNILRDVSAGKTWGESIGDFIVRSIDPVIQEQLGTELLLQIKNLEDEYGNPLTSENDSTGDVMWKVLGHIGKFATPGTITRLQRIKDKRKEVEDMEAVVEDYRNRLSMYPSEKEVNRLTQLEAELSRREYDLAETVEGTATSTRQYVFDPSTQLPQHVYKSVDKIGQLSLDYKQKEQEIGLKIITKRQRLEIYNELNDKYQEEIDNIKEYYKFANETGAVKYGWNVKNVLEQGIISKNEKQGSNYKKFTAMTEDVLKYIYDETSEKPTLTLKDHDKWMKE